MQTPEPTIDLASLRSWIGREEEKSEILTAGLVSRFRATLGANRVADSAPVAPKLIHLCLNGPDTPTERLGADGHPQKGGFLPTVPLPCRMWAAGSFIFHRDLKVGDCVRRLSRIADVVLKEGRTGTLCFVTVEHRHFAGNELAIEERQHIVYRERETGDPLANAQFPSCEGAHQATVEVGPPLLFRYSAMTFNSHRIHYDRPYAVEVEGYPGLVVHGPMQATLLLGFASRSRGAEPARFSFRGVGPIFDNDGLILNAAANGDRPLELWTTTKTGRLGMKAEAGW
jgi:3-methylfumaryl-CoA hydratase